MFYRLSYRSCIVISRAEQGCINSKLVMTSGCKTPIIPETFPFITISAQRPLRKRESERIQF